MRNNTICFCLFFSSIVSFVYSQELYQKKKVTEKDFKYEFYVTKKKPEINDKKVYYWFKGGTIHASEGGDSGELLDGVFEKFYLNNQLAEKGRFRKGLKVGIWKTWHSNGSIKTQCYWNNGRKNGSFYEYDERGILVEKGRFIKDKRQGKWVNFQQKDTLQYRRDDVFIKKISTKDSIRLLTKKRKQKEVKQKKDLKKKEKEQQKQSKAQLRKKNKEAKKQILNKKVEKKESFFKRLLSKKEKTHGKGE